ncbi:MAG: hypothetical protein ABIL58_02350 [Pseudomonadota bacterium]
MFSTMKMMVLGDTNALRMEQNCLVGVSIFAALALIIGSIFNAALEMPFFVVAGTFLLGLLFVVFYYLTRFKKIFDPLFWPMIGAGSLMLTFLWVYNAGLQGPAPIWAPIVIGFAVIIGKGLQRLLGTLMFFFNVCALMTIEYAAPEIIIGYSTRLQWFTDSAITAFIAALVTSLFVLFIHNSYTQQLTRAEENYAQLNAAKNKLEKAMLDVKILKGLLPVCASCKKVRDDTGYWNQIDEYIREHSEATVTHSICPDCAKRLYPDIDLS